MFSPLRAGHGGIVAAGPAELRRYGRHAQAGRQKAVAAHVVTTAAFYVPHYVYLSMVGRPSAWRGCCGPGRGTPCAFCS